MLIAVGTRVKLKHTGDMGEVSAILPDGMVNVRLFEDGMEIPTYLDDLIRIEEDMPDKSTKAKIVQGKQEKIVPEQHLPQANPQYKILKSLGIQLAFEPIHRTDGSTEAFEMYLINDTRYDVIFSLEIDIVNMPLRTINGKLNSLTYQSLGRLPFDKLNDAPIFIFECRQLTTAGTGAAMNKEVRIKAKQFFKKIMTAPLLDKPVHLYKVFEKFDNNEKEVSKKDSEDLKSYTKRNLVPKKKRKPNVKAVEVNDIKAYAEFQSEIDLHIENLTKGHEKLNNAQKLRIQMIAFEEYINKAYRLGVESVFVIHGVGKGRLKNEIAASLIKNPYVKTYSNEYHPRYGYGATEVIFL